MFSSLDQGVNTFGFDREKVIERCKGLNDNEDKINYLGLVLLEYENHPPKVDVNAGIKPSFKKFIKREIKCAERLLKLRNNTPRGITKITGRVSEIVRIFEEMKRSYIISPKTEASQIGSIFFTEQADIKNFAAAYNARKKDLVKEERRTSSEALLNFVLGMIDGCFAGKREILDRITDHIRKIN